MQKKYLQIAALAGATLLSLNASAQTNNNNNTTAANSGVTLTQEVQILNEKAPTLDPQILKLALTAYANAHRLGLDSREILTVIDYHDPDYEKRLWVFDLKDNDLLFNTYVAHGQGSGNVYADRFSDDAQTHESSIGLYETENTYYGHKGLSLRLDGLDKGFNDNALAREIVMHGAWYVQPQFATEYGRIGNSWGCPAVPVAQAAPIINTIKGGTLIFAYAPEWSWLHSSRYLDNA